MIGGIGLTTSICRESLEKLFIYYDEVSVIVSFQLTFIFIYNIFSKKISVPEK